MKCCILKISHSGQIISPMLLSICILNCRMNESKGSPKLLPKPVLVNSVVNTLEDLHPDLIRINGWPGFLKGNCLEAAAGEDAQKKAARVFGRELVFVKDLPGFVSARIVAMIINEAWFTREAGTASEKDIDLAMKLGTGYPYGPFEWTALIGRQRIATLLERLQNTEALYEIAEGLKHKASA